MGKESIAAPPRAWCDVPSPASTRVAQLVNASEADAELGFMARMLALCSLPRTNSGNRLQYVRRNGPYTLYMTATGSAKLPFGNLPRLLLAYVSTEGGPHTKSGPRPG